MTLRNWILKNGIRPLAREFDVDHSRIWHWKERKSLPNAHAMLRIVKVTKGEVTLEEMIADWCKYNRNKTRALGAK